MTEVKPPLKIGYIGNWNPAWTTENERAWSFRKLGHEVIQFQENRTNAGDLLRARPKLDLLLYSHTHDPSWEIDGLTDVLNTYKEKGVPTASVHLDVFAGLDRETDVGREAMWNCEHVFTADGSPEAAKLYDSKGINWHYLKPGVVERDCYLAEPDHDKFPHDVVFVGSRNYHAEYPGRPQLVEFLEKNYDLGLYGNDTRVVRGDELNTLYATSKVVVGDSCFAGKRKNYWSDRIPETTGRGGFLLHPKVEGLDHVGVPTWEAGNYLELRELIDWFLAADEERERLRLKAHEWTKKNRTYTHLSQEMLEVMGL